MELLRLTPSTYKQYYKFYKDFYHRHPMKKDNMVYFLKTILNGKSAISKRLRLQPLLVKDQGQIIMGTLLAQVADMADVLQLSFFEATTNSPGAFALIETEAQRLALEWGASQLSGSLNIHVNYGLGFLKSHHGEEASFGMNYNPAFYNDLFTDAGFTTIDLVTYKTDMTLFDLPLSDRLKARIDRQYSVRNCSFKDFKQDIGIYTDLNNNAFTDHLFYFQRSFDEDYELYKPFKLLLKEENLLIVEKKGQPVGFMLWYPDYCQLTGPGKGIGPRALFDYKVLGKTPSTFKIVEMGVVASEQRNGAILALFMALQDRVGDTYTTCESSWILAANAPSSNFGLKWSQGPYKAYAAYTKEVAHG